MKIKAASLDKHPRERISRMFPLFGQNLLNAELLVQLPVFQDLILDGGFWDMPFKIEDRHAEGHWAQ